LSKRNRVYNWFENEDAVLYRVGSISIEDIERVIGKIKIKRRNTAPGMLSKHYAPATTTFLKVMLIHKRLS
jgi:L-threonylcarbamoyladenylate synthase